MSDPAIARAHRQAIAAVLLLAALVVGVAIFATLLVGGASAAEPLNESVSVGNDTDQIVTTIEFANVSDANATADLVITDANGTEIVNETVAGNGTETVRSSWAVADTDPHGNYSVVVTADTGVVASAGAWASSSTSSGGAGGFLEGGLSTTQIGALIAAVAGAFLIARRAD